MDKFLQTLNIHDNTTDPIFDRPFRSIRKLVFEDSEDPLASSQDRPNISLLKKVIQKPSFSKFSSPSGKKPLSLTQNKSFTPIPEVKTTSMFSSLDLKSRSYSSLDSEPQLGTLAEDEVIEDYLPKSKHPQRLISPTDLSKLLKSNPDDVLIVDCRYSFEFEGGHITSAVCVNNDPSKLIETFFLQKSKSILSIEAMSFCSPTKEISNKLAEISLFQEPRQKKTIVFHCEFSQARGPRMYDLLRNCDREVNCKHYPRLTYPDVYLLEGGYNKFVEAFPELCEPNGSYVRMKNKRFVKELMEEQEKSRKIWEIMRKKKEEIKKILTMEVD